MLGYGCFWEHGYVQGSRFGDWCAHVPCIETGLCNIAPAQLAVPTGSDSVRLPQRVRPPRFYNAISRRDSTTCFLDAP